MKRLLFVCLLAGCAATEPPISPVVRDSLVSFQADLQTIEKAFNLLVARVHALEVKESPVELNKKKK